MRTRTALLLSALALTALACGGDRNPGDDWLVRSDPDTLTVLELSDLWTDLDSASRAGFLSQTDPAAVFVEATAYRMLLEATVRDLGLLEDPRVLAFGRSWLRTEASIAMRALQESREAALITDADLAALAGDPGQGVWLSVLPSEASAEACGPFFRFELPPDLAGSLDSMPPGSLWESPDGLRLRLDSITATNPGLSPTSGLPAMDSTSIPIVVQGRLRFRQLAALASIKGDGSFRVDEAAIDRLVLQFARTPLPAAGDEPLLTCAYGTWTAADIVSEVAFFQTRFPFVPSDRTWMGFVLDNILQQCYLEELYREEAPLGYDSLRGLAEEYVLTAAFDRLRADSVLSRLDPGLAEEERAALEAQATDAWLTRLAESRHLVVNEELLRELSADPGDWSGTPGETAR